MVQLKEDSDYEKLETIIQEISRKHNYKVFITGWTRKTFDIYDGEKKLNKMKHLARLESLAINNGEIRFFHDGAKDFIHELGEALEREFDIKEAVVIREKPPEY